MEKTLMLGRFNLGGRQGRMNDTHSDWKHLPELRSLHVCETFLPISFRARRGNHGLQVLLERKFAETQGTDILTASCVLNRRSVGESPLYMTSG